MKLDSKKIRARRHRLPLSAYRGRVCVSITACIYGRNSIFIDEDIVLQNIDFLRNAVQANECSVPIYCFMPDHLHLVIRGESANADAWKAMVEFKQKSGYWLKSTYPNFRWQPSFYDHILRDEKALHNVIAYIANNPVKANLVTRWEDYSFTGSIGSSFRDFIESD